MKQKLTSLLAILCALLMSISFLNTAAFAAGSGTPVISVDKVEAKPGDTVNVNVRIDNNPGVLGMVLNLSYSSDLTLVGAKNGGAFSSLTMTKPGKLVSPCNFVWDGEEIAAAQIKDGVILTLTFKVSEAASENSTLAIKASYDTNGIVDADLNAVNPSINNGSITTVRGEQRNPFVDVEAGAFYEKPVLWAVNAGVTTGLSPTLFGPNEPCTRGQIVTFLWRAAGEPEPGSSANPFADVNPTDFYYKAVLWAVEQGITNGLSATSFGPNEPCTRGQVATFLWRYAGEPAPTSGNPFSDVAATDFCYKAVLWAVENGVTTGVGGGRFAPVDTCTRGQIVTFLYRAIA